MKQLLFFSDEHSPIFTTLWKWLENTYHQKVYRHPHRYEQFITKQATTRTILIGWLQRMKQIHVLPPALVRLSMMLHFFNCPHELWQIFSHLRLVLSINTTKRMYSTATAITLPIRNSWMDHQTIAIIGADNMSYITHKRQIRTENHTAVTFTWLDTINMWQRYTEPNYFPNFRIDDHLFRTITPDILQVRMDDVFLDSTRLNLVVQSAYTHSLSLLKKNVSHIDLPEHEDNTPPPQIEFKIPLFNLTTSKYIHMELFLDHIYHTYFGK